MNIILLLEFELTTVLQVSHITNDTLFLRCWPSTVEGQDSPNKCPRYNTKSSNGEAPVMLELWVMWSTPSLPSLPGPLWLGVVTLGKVLSVDQIQLNCILMSN